jgi:hypothetical protein
MPMFRLSQNNPYGSKQEMKMNLYIHTKKLYLLFSFILLFSVGGCNNHGPNIKFKTIAQNYGSGYGSEEPAILIITNEDEIDPIIKSYFYQREIINALHKIDFKHNFVVLVNYGWILETAPKITIQEITRNDDSVVVKADFHIPCANCAVGQGSSSPFHLVSVSKSGHQWGKQIKFTLISAKDNQIKAETESFIP